MRFRSFRPLLTRDSLGGKQGNACLGTGKDISGSSERLGPNAQIRETMPTLPVIIISGHLRPGQALTQGATQFVAKPYLLEAVVASVHEALDGAT